MSDSCAVLRLPLTHGAHGRPPIDALVPRDPDAVPSCAMERAFLRWAFRQGWSIEEIVNGWTDRMSCASLIVGYAYRGFNDLVGKGAVADARRAAVFTEDVLDAIAGTAGSEALEERRKFALSDWSFRTATPKLLALGHFAEWGPRLAALPEIVDVDTLAAGRQLMRAMRNAVWADWMEEYAKYQAAAAEAAEAAAAAEAAEAAEAEAAEEEAAAEEAAAEEAAEEAAAAAASLFTPETRRAAREASKKSRISGQNWSSQKAAARAIFDEALVSLRPALTKVRDELDADFRALLLRVCAMTDSPEVST